MTRAKVTRKIKQGTRFISLALLALLIMISIINLLVLMVH